MLEKKHFISQEWESRYENIDWDKHCYIRFYSYNVHYYREIKLIHEDLNTYSMAQIVRMVVEYFLDVIEEKGFINGVAFLEEERERWGACKVDNRVWEKRMIQKISSFWDPPRRPKYEIKYSTYFSPLYIKLIEEINERKGAATNNYKW